MAILRDYPDFGKKLCEIFGLDLSKTQNIRIINNVNDVVRIEVDMVLRVDEGEKLIKELQKYELHLVESISVPAFPNDRIELNSDPSDQIRNNVMP